MQIYRHPHKDVSFILQHLLAFDDFLQVVDKDDIDMALVTEILNQASGFAQRNLEPINRSGDISHPTLAAFGVSESPGFSEAYREFVAQGWPAISANPAYGGQGLPNIVATACNEIWQSCNLSFSLCSLLGEGAIAAIQSHGSVELQQQFLPNLISGRWTGTMNLTESHAGSDLSLIKIRAVLEGEQYKVFGQKVFITWGDHQMSDNILHLVLARLPNAPEGVKGISLFLVPKYLADNDGNYTVLNDIKCLSLEKKLGIHASPTCVMSYGESEGAVAYLIGEAHQGLNYMFTMMNKARQAVALQGLAVTEYALQLALHYAESRIQGKNSNNQSVAIIEHGDIKRMLLALKSGSEAMRALCYYTSFLLDRSKSGSSDQKEHDLTQIEFLTPIVKGWCTELAQELVSLSMQIHGGAGYIEESGVAQLYRDVRILSIYEGTTGIQGLDLLLRKTLADKGTQAYSTLSEIRSILPQLKGNTTTAYMYQALSNALIDTEQSLVWVLNNPQRSNESAVNFLQIWGYLMAGWLMAKSLLQLPPLVEKEGEDLPFLEAKALTIKFYAEYFLVRTAQYKTALLSCSDEVMNMDKQHFFSHLD